MGLHVCIYCLVCLIQKLFSKDGLRIEIELGLRIIPDCVSQ